ncbi:hypothetical protein [Actibacterium lipolyticum]|uniref:DUF3313 domain-containing protein n=1 Tax=Actibacterium lipolyticum TaxID=1524263 RepID=A0A238JJN3_9RHOB|nr:hypothetical protein [Actibacterium lipolyticum]SMX30880.1 hypothetical protein COL8621_00165 [Actibacterium lipolyticum]
MKPFLKLARLVVCIAGIAIVAGCTTSQDIPETPEPLGDFALGFNIVVAKNAQLIPPSRKAEPEEWEASIKSAIDQRFGRYEGDKLYHLGVSVDGFALAVPGIPVVLSPKSALVVTVNIWDDAAQAKLNEKPKQLTVLESLSGDTVLGSGLTQSREKQMKNLSFNTARLIERWLVENRAEWFGELEAPETSDAEAALEGTSVAQLPETSN